MDELISLQRSYLLEVELHLSNAVLALMCDGWQPSTDLLSSAKVAWVNSVPDLKSRLLGGGVATEQNVGSRISCTLSGKVYTGPGSPAFTLKVRRSNQNMEFRAAQLTSPPPSAPPVIATPLVDTLRSLHTHSNISKINFVGDKNDSPAAGAGEVKDVSVLSQAEGDFPTQEAL